MYMPKHKSHKYRQYQLLLVLLLLPPVGLPLRSHLGLDSGGLGSLRRGWPPPRSLGDLVYRVGRPASGACASRSRGTVGGRGQECPPPLDTGSTLQPDSLRPHNGRSRLSVASQSDGDTAVIPTSVPQQLLGVHGYFSVYAFNKRRERILHNLPMEAWAP